jgi:hypothetical protein
MPAYGWFQRSKLLALWLSLTPATLARFPSLLIRHK